MFDRVKIIVVALAGASIGGALLAVPPLAAQEAQGPPDGFIAPAPTRTPAPRPAQGPDDGGIPPLAVPRPQSPAPTPQLVPPISTPAQPTVERSAAQPVPVRPRLVTAPAPAQASPAPRSAAAPALAPTLPGESTATETPPLVVPEARLPEPSTPPAALPVATPEALPWAPIWWPWALALVAASVAGLWWLRRDRAEPAMTNGAEAAVAVPQVLEKPTSPPARPPAPLPSPRTPPAAPPPAAAAPAPMPVSGRARLTMTLQVEAIEMLPEQARIRFALLLANQGDRAATGGLVRIALQQANRQQSELLERFFDGAGGSVLAEDVEIAPGDVGTIARNALLPLAQVEPMLVAGYPSLIPVIGFDVTYHWEGEGDAFGQVAAAYVLGSLTATDGKIAPVRLDLPPRRLASPSARVTEMQRLL